MYEVLVFVALVSAAMLVGLMTTLLSVMRGMWRSQSDERAGASFRDFLQHAATNRILSTLSILPVICAVVIGFVGAPRAATYAYALTGGAVFLIGFLVWTAVFNLPIYRAMASWDERAADEVRPLLRRFHRANAVRPGSALVSTVLFFLAA